MPLIVIGIPVMADFAAVSAIIGLPPERDSPQSEVGRWVSLPQSGQQLALCSEAVPVTGQAQLVPIAPQPPPPSPAPGLINQAPVPSAPITGAAA